MKNIILINTRSFLHLYDLKELKKKYNLRISAIVSSSAYSGLSDSIKKSLDEIYILPNPTKKIFSPFPENLLCPIIEKELCNFQNTWIVTVDEASVLTAASLREKYRLLGPSVAVISNFKDKVKQKEILSKGGIRTPKFLSVERGFSDEKIEYIYHNLAQKLKIPFILKPTDMGGTTGVAKIKTYNDFRKYLAKFDNFTHLIAEEFIDEKLFHCDFIIQEGKYVFIEVSEYLSNGLAYVLDGCNHGSLPLMSDNPIRASIIDFCKKANSLLGLRSGCAHFEVFVTREKEIIFLEAAARPAGSGVPLVFTHMYKRNYMNAALLAEVHEKFEEFNIPEEYCFWSCFSRKSGTIAEFKAPPLESTYHLEWYMKVGDTSIASSSIMEKAGMLLAHHPNYELLKSDFYSLKNFKAIVVKEY
ncbi:MAG: ATP-grasp domain-containing protein [Candidatus Paracaedibacter sp.]